MKKICYLGLIILTILLVGCKKEHIHIYDKNITKETCETDGLIIYTCECGFSYTEERKAIGHNFSSWTITVTPTCANVGAESRICDRCEKEETKELAMLEHMFEPEWVRDETYHWFEAICDHKGEQINKEVHNFSNNNICIECGYEINGTKGLKYKLSEDKTGYFVIGYNDIKLEEIEIPSRHGQLEVIGIGEGAFNANFNLINITLPNTIKIIETKAFANCINLLEIFIPEGVTVIKKQTFENCYALTNLSLKEGLVTIESLAFEDCPYLKYIVMPKSVKTIEAEAFKNCVSIKKIYYNGTQTDWDMINIDPSNITIINASKHVRTT